MKIDKKAVDNVNATITINIDINDYKSKFNSELKKYAQKAQMKGFRAGKTPISVVRKMYGQKLLVEVVNDTLQNAIADYLDKADFKIIGQPIPSDDQVGDLNFDINNMESYEFKFDIGLIPTIDVAGVSDEDEYEIYKIKVDKKTIDKELDQLRKHFGVSKNIDGKTEEKDILTIQADELSGKKKKKDGWATEFTVMVDMLEDEVKDKVLKLSKNDTFTFDVNNLEKDRNEEYVKKYILKIQENDTEKEEEPVIGNMFIGKIVNISRHIEAALDQELFDKAFGKDEVSSEKDAVAKLKGNVEKHYGNQAKQVMYRNIMDKLVADTKVELPEAFLKRWLKMTNEKLSDEEIEKDFPAFIDSTKWNLIKSELSNKFEVEVSAEEVKESMANKIKGYMGQYGMDESMIDGIMENLMQNKEEVNKTYEELVSSKVFDKIGDTVKTKDKSITIDKFNDFVKDLNEKHKAQ
ncbi:MAG: trigger factor [Saprospiraceae bacterium]